MKGKKKLKITLTIISLVVLICLFFTYKGYYYLLYRPNNDIDTFTKTYQVLDITEKEDNSKTYLKLKQYQMEEEVTVEVSNSFAYNLEKDKYYEFTLQKTSNNIEDNIGSIFENTNLLSINLSTKEGLDQTQESPK